MALPGNPVADRAAQIGANSSAVADFVDGIATDTVTDPLTYVGGIGLGVSGASLFGRLTSFFRKTDVTNSVEKPDFIVSSKGTTMPTNKDFNLVDSNQQNGDWFLLTNAYVLSSFDERCQFSSLFKDENLNISSTGKIPKWSDEIDVCIYGESINKGTFAILLEAIRFYSIIINRTITHAQYENVGDLCASGNRESEKINCIWKLRKNS